MENKNLGANYILYFFIITQTFVPTYTRCSIQTSLISINHKTESMKERAMKLERLQEKLIDFTLLTLVHLYM